MSKYINAELIKALMKNDRLMQGNAESVMWQQEVERRVDRLPSIDTEFIDFLFNVINPNEMEEYISMFKARAEQTEPITSGVVWTEEAIKNEPKSYSTWASNEPRCEDCKYYREDVESIACERCLGGKYSRFEPKTEPSDWKDQMWLEAVEASEQTEPKCEYCKFYDGEQCYKPSTDCSWK